MLRFCAGVAVILAPISVAFFATKRRVERRHHAAELAESKVTIRPAERKFVPLMAVMCQQMAREIEGLELDIDVLTNGVTKVFDNPQLGFYVLAFVDSHPNPVGMCGITFEWSDWRNKVWWWLQSVYVVAEFRKLGVFNAMFAHLKSNATTSHVAGFRLYVDSGNHRARGLYSKHKFQICHYDMMEHEFIQRGSDA